MVISVHKSLLKFHFEFLWWHTTHTNYAVATARKQYCPTNLSHTQALYKETLNLCCCWTLYHLFGFQPFINPLVRMHSVSYSSCSVCVCLSVCGSVFSILSSRAFRHPMRGISGYSVGNAVKLKSRFL